MRGEKTGERQVTFHFDSKGNRELPQILGGLTVLPKHFWEGKDEKGEPRDLSKSTLEMPLGSGPYRVKHVDRGRAVTFERVKDWWAKDLPVAKGQWNFDEIRIEYFRERTAAFEAFKAGQIDYWPENTAKAWATDYDFAAVKRGLVKLETHPTERVAPMQAFAFNTRKPQFQDVRVRRALHLAFNFEAMNEQLLYSMYTRTASYFDNSELKSSGLPQGRELAILKEVEKDLPKEVFTQEWKNPVGGADSQHRRNLGEASRLLREAGWTLQGTQVRNGQGQPLKVELLLNSPTFERHGLRYVEDLKKIGIDASVRTINFGAVPAPHPRLRLRDGRLDVRPVDLARQRAAHVLVERGGRPGRQPQHHRHQEPGDRQADRQGDLRQGPAGTGGRDPRARPGLAVELLPGAAVVLFEGSPRLLGQVRPSRQAAVADLLVRPRSGGTTRRRRRHSPTSRSSSGGGAR